MPDTYLMKTDVSARTNNGYGTVSTAQVERLFDRKKGLTIQKPLMMSGFAARLPCRPDISVRAKWVRLGPLYPMFSIRWASFGIFAKKVESRVLGLCQK